MSARPAPVDAISAAGEQDVSLRIYCNLCKEEEPIGWVFRTAHGAVVQLFTRGSNYDAAKGKALKDAGKQGSAKAIAGVRTVLAQYLDDAAPLYVRCCRRHYTVLQTRALADAIAAGKKAVGVP